MEIQKNDQSGRRKISDKFPLLFQSISSSLIFVLPPLLTSFIHPTSPAPKLLTRAGEKTVKENRPEDFVPRLQSVTRGKTLVVCKLVTQRNQWWVERNTRSNKLSDRGSGYTGISGTIWSIIPGKNRYAYQQGSGYKSIQGTRQTKIIIPLCLSTGVRVQYHSRYKTVSHSPLLRSNRNIFTPGTIAFQVRVRYSNYGHSVTHIDIFTRQSGHSIQRSFFFSLLYIPYF